MCGDLATQYAMRLPVSKKASFTLTATQSGKLDHHAPPYRQSAFPVDHILSRYIGPVHQWRLQPGSY
jgi:hypothetical protein